MALAAVVGLGLVALLISALILTAVVGSFKTTTASRANVQAQASAQAGIVAAYAGIQSPASCASKGGVYASATVPKYSATVYVPNGSGGWLAACPNSQSGQVRIVSTGTAADKGVGGQSSSDVAYVEALYTLSGAGTGPNDGSIFNTGTNGAGGIATAGQSDKAWKVAGPYSPTTSVQTIESAGGLSPYTTAGTQVWKPATVGNQAPLQWAASPYGDAQWVYLNDNSYTVGGDWYYRYQFSLPDANTASKFALSISFLADNTASEVWVNGVAQSTKTVGLPQNAPYPATQYTGATGNSTSVDTNTKPYNPYFYYGYKLQQAANTSLASDWIAGTNTIIVLVKSYPYSQGFLAQMRTPDLGLCQAGYTGASPPVAVTCATPTLVYNRNVTSATG
jgi:hypothetical protein